MNIIVCPHELAMGGSQINAIELAATMRDRGHHVLVYAPEGELAQKIEDLGLEHVKSPSGTKMSFAWLRGLAQAISRHDADIVHTYEWATSLSASYAARWLGNATQVMTVLSMDVPRFMPSHVHLIVGTRQLAAARTERISVIEPPIDTVANCSTDVPAARASRGFKNDEVVIAVVCRMTKELDKANGILEAVECVDALAESVPLRFIIAGAGPELQEIRRQAVDVNERHSREVVEIAGNVLDPSPIYESADIVLGMGSSVLRAMAYSKPVVVQGANGFWQLLSEETLETFLWAGFYGDGGGGSAELRGILEQLFGSPETRSRLGRWNRKLVRDHFSLESASDKLEHTYMVARAEPRRKRKAAWSVARSVGGLAKFRLARAFQERVGS